MYHAYHTKSSLFLSFLTHFYGVVEPSEGTVEKT